MPEVVAEFISHPRASMSTRDTPIRASVGSEANSSYQVHTATIKAFKDLDQTIRVPEFTGWETVNLVCLRFTGDWMYFWVTASRTSSTVMGAVEFALTYNGPLSQLGLNGAYTASVMRSPYTSLTKQTQVISGAMEFSRSIELGSIKGPLGYKVYWLQLTATEYMTDAAPAVRESNHLSRYGWFVSFNEDNQINHRLTASNGTMPSLNDIISTPTVLGFSSADVITDISISEICPFYYSYDSSSGYTLRTLPSGGTTLHARNWGESKYVYWALDEEDSYPRTAANTVTMTLTEMEMTCGSVTITDRTGSSLVSIPTAWFGSDRSLTVTTKVFADYSGMTYRIEVNGSIIQAPCSHLPYLGSAWETYRAYSMAYDRQAMNNTIDTATRQTELGISTSAANAIVGLASTDVTGALTSVAGQYISAWSSRAANDISAESLRTQQAITERRMQAQPATVYGSQYGLMYCFETWNTPAAIQLSMPAGLTAATFNAYGEAFGFANETVDADTTITQGYWQLRFSTQTGLDSGPRFDRLNSMITNGIRITGSV